MSDSRSHGHGGRWAFAITAIGVVVAIVALWPTFGSYFLQLNENQSQPPAAVSALPTEATTNPVENASTPAPAEAAQPVQIAPPVMNEIVVGTVVATPAVPCCIVGPGLFELGDDNSTTLGYTWSSRMSDGTENDSEGCAMLITITGPENPPSLRKNDCSVSRSNGFSNYGNIATVSTTGTYTITVVDEVSGVTGVGSFTVVQ
jgi:hypothetical protein